MKQWNFGVIGAGVIGDFHAKAITDTPNAKLIGICDIVSEKAQELAKKYSCKVYKNYNKMLTDSEIDAVTIGTPSGLHMKPAIAAAKAGKHVLCEKPLEITLKKVDKMIEAHEKAGTTLGCVFQVRYTECLTHLRNAIAQGRFGVLTYAGSYVPWYRTEQYYKDSWHGTWKMDGGGALMNQSIHMIDLMCDMVGLPDSVQAFANNIGHPGIEAEDTAVAALRFKSGMLGIIYGTTSSYPGHFKRFEITGTKGTVVFLEDSFSVWKFEDSRPEDKEIIEKYGNVSSGQGGVLNPADIPYKLHTNQVRDFVDALDKNRKYRVNGQEARKSVALILAIYKAAKIGKMVRL